MPKAKNRLHATRVDRIAIVDRPAVPDAQIVLFKRLEEIIEKGAISFQDLPMVDEGKTWASSEAVKRVREWAGGDKIDMAKYRKAFMWYDAEDAENFGAYKLPYADVIDGKLVAVPKAIFAIVQAIAGARGGVDIPKEDKTKVLANCKKYYKKMDKEFPSVSIKSWDDSSVFEKDFNTSFAYRVTEAAVDCLQTEIWNAIYGPDSESAKTVDAAFADFTKAITMILANITINKQGVDEVKLTEDEIIKPFVRGLQMVAISEMFSYFRGNMAYMVANNYRLDNPEKIIGQMVELFKGTIDELTKKIIANKRDESVPVFEKEGRVISAVRLAKLKQMISVLTELVSEAEVRYSKKSKEETTMELKEILEKIEKISADVTAIVPRLTAIEGTLKEKGLVMTEAEKAQKEAGEKKLALEKRAESVGLAKDSTEEVISKKEKEIQEQKAAKDKQDKEVAEKALKDKQELEKKEKDDMNSRFGKLEKALTDVAQFVETISKKFGMKTSIDVDMTGKSLGAGGDVFGDAVKGKSKSK